MQQRSLRHKYIIMLDRIVSDAEVSTFFLNTANWKVSEFVDELHNALKRYSGNPSIIPPRIVGRIPSGEAGYLYMPVIDDVYSGVKTLGFNQKSNLGFVGSITVLQPSTGLLKGVCEAKQITAIRTALVSCVGLSNQLSRFRNETTINCTVFGTGLQAFWHIFCCLRLFHEKSNVSKFNVSILYRSSAMNLSCFDDMLTSENIDVSFDQISLRDKVKLGLAIDKSQVIFSCVPSTEPHLNYDLLANSSCEVLHTFISLIGSYKPFMHECDTKLVRAYKEQKVPILVDSKEHTLLEAGELIDAKIEEEGLIEIGKLCENSLESITLNENGRTVSLCKIVGLAIMDLCIAKKFMDGL